MEILIWLEIVSFVYDIILYFKTSKDSTRKLNLINTFNKISVYKAWHDVVYSHNDLGQIKYEEKSHNNLKICRNKLKQGYEIVLKWKF